MNDAIRVLVVDDHEIVRKGIRALLSKDRGIQVIGEAANGAAAITQAGSLKPDVILMDLMMPKVDGIEATRQITTAHPDVHVLVLTSFAADDKVFPAIKAGALGYLLKDSSPTELLQAIRQVHQGQPSLDSSIALKVLQEMAHPTQEAPTTHPLTEREEQVVRLIAHGKSNREIADELSVAKITVSKHISNILGKLHLASRTQAALYALKEGLASLEDVPPRISE
ncbi:MAG: response regulator transcription factor [Chloroflexi bacterium]|nr:response regulator transcription factor [Chloroflexota bacterium]